MDTCPVCGDDMTAEDDETAIQLDSGVLVHDYCRAYVCDHEWVDGHGLTYCAECGADVSILEEV